MHSGPTYSPLSKTIRHLMHYLEVGGRGGGGGGLKKRGTSSGSWFCNYPSHLTLDPPFTELEQL